MTEANTDEDRYLDAATALQKIVAADDFPQGQVERIEVTMLASGECTWRVWPARAEEPVGGYIAAP